MRSNTAKKLSAPEVAQSKKAFRPELVVVKPEKSAATPANTSPDFEDFMNQYGMWSDFA